MSITQSDRVAPSVDLKYLSLLWAGAERAADLGGLHSQLFDETWDEATFASLLEHPGTTALVAQAGRPPILLGFVIGQMAADEAEILSLGVAPQAHRAGIGLRLVQGLARAVARAEARQLFLEVAADNSAARALYAKAGFAEVGIRRGYYLRHGAPAVDALTLALVLTAQG